jgi:hypothetical protein
MWHRLSRPVEWARREVISCVKVVRGVVMRWVKTVRCRAREAGGKGCESMESRGCVHCVSWRRFAIICVMELYRVSVAHRAGKRDWEMVRVAATQALVRSSG